MGKGNKPTAEENTTAANIPFPGYSSWEHISYCCTDRAIRVGNLGRVFLGHWEVDLGIPFAVSFLIVTSYLFTMLIIFQQWPCVILPVIFSVLFFAFIYSYVRTIADGPGYFPFYYPLPGPPGPVDDDGTDLSSLLPASDCSPAGILSTLDQMTWVKERVRPNRCIFSSSARRLVIRPDHFCGWTSTWIGKRNHKFFWLFNFWGSSYILSFLIFDVRSLWAQIEDNNISLWFGIGIIYCFFGFAFFLMTIGFACDLGYGILINQTSWENWNNISSHRFNKGIIRNIEDVCGSRREWWQWLLPISPWKDKSNEDMIAEYTTYRRDSAVDWSNA
jgi:hypothetical protein